MTKKNTKKVKCVVKLRLPAGQSNIPPAAGSALGPRGVKAVMVCKEFGAMTQTGYTPGEILSAIVTIFEDLTFDLKVSIPTTSLLKKAAGIQSGSAKTKRIDHVGSITQKQLEEIAQAKMSDLNAYTMEAACATIRASAASMGISVRD
ncbi:50S ribosomal protein L11 [Rickettsiales endosymbiont of Paramecium tredecaurelia]|uniref:50S ribosomal protein L11 n=1 Tax=Candidatus Sarmatiella mevalonica TaxID=2770581 RepID=UPI0019235F7C|nr:50S ribosomal protein L11 [Candidatus Sarmatiella mevalonica]MBL3284832.1 50S ribosomal protein L11 [Candidatus Sarmatiella mevalonica]